MEDKKEVKIIKEGKDSDKVGIVLYEKDGVSEDPLKEVKTGFDEYGEKVIVVKYNKKRVSDDVPVKGWVRAFRDLFDAFIEGGREMKLYAWLVRGLYGSKRFCPVWCCVDDICRQFRISRSTAYEWLNKLEDKHLIVRDKDKAHLNPRYLYNGNKFYYKHTCQEFDEFEKALKS